MFKQTSEGTLLFLKVTPKSSFTKVIGIENNVLKVAIAAPPEKGAANEKLLTFLAAYFHIARSSLQLVKGETNRHKTVLMKGKTAAELQSFLSKISMN